jgi:CRP-like cAMP-binding protein
MPTEARRSIFSAFLTPRGDAEHHHHANDESPTGRIGSSVSALGAAATGSTSRTSFEVRRSNGTEDEDGATATSAVWDEQSADGKLRIGTAGVHVVEVAGIPTPKAKYRDYNALFATVQIGSGRARTPAVLRGGHRTQFGVGVDIPLYREPQGSAPLLISLYEAKAAGPVTVGSPAHLVGLGQLEVPADATQYSAEEWVTLSYKRQYRGKVRVMLSVDISGVSTFLSAFSQDNTVDVQREDEHLTTRELLVQVPELLKEIKYAVRRAKYVLEPLLVARKQVMALLLWRSAPASTMAFVLTIYTVYSGNVVPVTIIIVGLHFGARVGTALQHKAKGEVPFRDTDSFSTRQELMDAAAAVADRTRLGYRTSLPTDVRAMVKRIHAVSSTAERVRVMENEPRTVAQAAAGFLVLGVALVFGYPWRMFVAVVRVGAILAVVYMFTLWPLYKHYPHMRSQYSVRALISMIAQVVQQLLGRVHNRWRSSSGALASSAGMASFSSSSGRHSSLDMSDDVSFKSMASEYNEEKLGEVLVELAHPQLGVNVMDRRRLMTKYPRTFVGREAVDWLYTHMNVEAREDAIEVASLLYDAGYITDPKGRPRRGFLDELHALYSFDRWKLRELRQKHRKDSGSGTSDALSPALVEERFAALSQSELTERDWKLLLTGSVAQRYEPDAVILEQRVPNQHLYRLKSGFARVEIENDMYSGTKHVGTLKPGSMFGEMSVLDNQGLTTARIVADTPVVVDRIRESFVVNLFQSEPDLSRRFYLNMALKLCDRLDTLATKSRRPGSRTASTREVPSRLAGALDKEWDAEEKTNFGNGGEGADGNGNGGDDEDDGQVDSDDAVENEEARADADFNELFNLHNEVLIKRYPASFRSHAVIVIHGTFYLSTKYACFYGKVFGRSVKECLPFDGIKAVTIPTKGNGRRVEIHGLQDSKVKFEFMEGKAAQEVMEFMDGLVKVAQEGKESRSKAADVVASVSKRFGSATHSSFGALGVVAEAQRALASMQQSATTAVKSGTRRKSGTSDLPPPLSTSSRTESESSVDTVGSSEGGEGGNLSVEESEILTTEDWDLILSGAKVTVFRDNEVIIEEGKKQEGIFQLGYGRCRVEKGGKKLGYMEQGALFGEISFLRSAPATATVLADGSAEVYIIPVDMLRSLFLRQPSLAGRSFHYLASVLQSRIRERERASFDANLSPRSLQSTPSGSASSRVKMSGSFVSKRLRKSAFISRSRSNADSRVASDSTESATESSNDASTE